MVCVLELLLRDTEVFLGQFGRVKLLFTIKDSLISASAYSVEDRADRRKLSFTLRKGTLQKRCAVLFFKDLHETASRSFSIRGNSSSALVFKHTLLATSRAVIPV